MDGEVGYIPHLIDQRTSCLPGCPSARLLQVLGEFQMAAGGKALTMGGGSMQVGHVAHLAGAAVGVLLVLLVARLPDADE
jgi:hypothetical protein